MSEYNDDCDYCGPSGSAISKCISRFIFGVDVNRCCYLHDEAYREGTTEADRKAADLAFYEGMKAEICRARRWWSPLRYHSLAWALRRYHAVRWFGKAAFAKKS